MTIFCAFCDYLGLIEVESYEVNQEIDSSQYQVANLTDDDGAS